MENLGERLAAVRDRMARAAGRAHRDPASILLLAVTKIFPASAIREAYQLGLRDFGENYVQEFDSKAPEVAGLANARFHFIGHLQSNKTRRAAELFHTIQTVDSAKIARRLDEAGRPLDIMLEVKLSGEDAKSGAGPADLPALIAAVRQCPNLRLTGLMTMPPWSEDPEAPRRPALRTGHHVARAVVVARGDRPTSPDRVPRRRGDAREPRDDLPVSLRPRPR